MNCSCVIVRIIYGINLWCFSFTAPYTAEIITTNNKSALKHVCDVRIQHKSAVANADVT